MKVKFEETVTTNFPNCLIEIFFNFLHFVRLKASQKRANIQLKSFHVLRIINLVYISIRTSHKPRLITTSETHLDRPQTFCFRF